MGFFVFCLSPTHGGAHGAFHGTHYGRGAAALCEELQSCMQSLGMGVAAMIGGLFIGRDAQGLLTGCGWD